MVLNNSICQSCEILYFCMEFIHYLMTVSVLFFGVASDLSGSSSTQMELLESSTVLTFRESLKNTFPRLKNLSDFAIAVNEEYANDNDLISDGDEIAVLPPVSGG